MPLFGPVLFLLLSAAAGQLVGKKNETPPSMPYSQCTRAGGCTVKNASAVLDANWRWLHTTAGKNCYNGNWSSTYCEDPKECAENCALEGVTEQEYASTYGVTPIQGGLQLRFVSMGPGGMNVGSRLYLMGDDGEYVKFALKNREITFDVDVSKLPCGLNGAVYFSEMEADGGKNSLNKAGAKYGTGYCDAQCPHDVKFMEGKANVLDWNVTGATGRYGACCAEMDLWEANSKATAFTPHGCSKPKTFICEGSECGDNLKNERYKGVCDKDGCDFNSYRMGEKSFFGPGSDFTVDSSKPITIVTQFITTDGTDNSDLHEIRRYYVQNGKVIPNSHAPILGDEFQGNSITDAFCDKQKDVFEDDNDFQKKGGLKTLSEALDRGMVLVMSLWDDTQTHMLWLDSAMGSGGLQKPGVLRGPCSTDTGKPQEMRQKYPNATVSYMNIKYGEMNSTFNAGRTSLDTLGFDVVDDLSSEVII